MTKILRAKLLKHWPTLAKIKELEYKLKEEKVCELGYCSDSDIKYKNCEYIADWRVAGTKRQLRDKHKEELQSKELKISDLEIQLKEHIINYDEMQNDILKAETKLKKVTEELSTSFERESQLRRDLLEAMKLNNALNSRTVETVTTESEPIETQREINKLLEGK